MAVWNQAELQEQVEALVDGTTLDAVLAALEETCLLKAEHLAVNWQDRRTALAWKRAARLLERARMRCDV
jgi:hypothetical protein